VDGILIPMCGVLISGMLGLTCLFRPRLHPYFLSALATPFATSVVFLLGAFWLADMNPAREYGPTYIPNGREHDPTRIDYVLWLSAVIGTMVLTAVAAYFGQRLSIQALKRIIPKVGELGRWLLRQSRRIE
jgi:hypothetical protein